MFTGIIDHFGTIAEIESLTNRLRIGIKHEFSGLELGESIAVDGICLTVSQFQSNIFYCDISPESLKLTTAKNFKINQEVNLERALQPTSRIGGHFVMGHIDQIAQIKKIENVNEFIKLTIAGLNSTAKKFIIKKGSIAINGVSLTINDIDEEDFTVMLVPHTLGRTNLKELQVNDFVNLEFDMLARIIVKQLENLHHE